MGNENKRYYWLKLKRDFFKRHDIRIVEGMPNGKDYILFYLKLLVESIDHEGTLRFSDTVPYNEEMLSIVTNTNVDIVRSAMKIFLELGMVEIWDDATIFMIEAEKMMGSETAWAEKKRRQKQLPMLLNGSVRLNGEMLRLPDGTTRYVDEKRYGGYGMFVLDRAMGKCEICGSSENVVIHHNNGYSNDPEDLICLCKKCHSKVERGDFPPIVHHQSNAAPPSVQQEIENRDKSIDIDKDNPPKSPKGEKGEKKSRPTTTPEFDDPFETFWNAFPKRRKTAKQECRKKYEGILRGNKDLTPEKMLTALEAQKRSKDWMKQNGEYVPSPLTWLNQGRWEDEIYEGGLDGNTQYVITEQDRLDSL